jgi:Nodulation protein Z (NodZ)
MSWLPMKLESFAHDPRFRPLWRVVNEFRLQGRAGKWPIELDANNGFFAQLNWCVYLLAYCEEQKRVPALRLTSWMYSDLPNHDWFHDYFEDVYTAASSAVLRNPQRLRPLRITHIQETDAAKFASTMSIREAHRLFTTHFRIRANIQSYVDDFVSREFAGDGVIGLHFRGTDKKSEAEPVEWPRCFRSVMKLAEDRPELKKVFISSDDAKFIEWFAKQADGTLSVIAHSDKERSWDGQPIHYNPQGNKYQKGFEALVNCLLLSRCTALIRTASFLSGWSSIFNPSLPITLLNEPIESKLWFPDSECIKRSDNRYRLP